MRKKITLSRGIAALALSAFVLTGCQNFLSEDKPVPVAKNPSQDIQLAAQEASAQAASSQVTATTEPAKDLPVIAAEPPKPLISELASTPAVPDNAADCKDIYAQMQTALQTPNEPLYMELKNRFGSLNCDHSKVSVPIVPPVPQDSATICNNLKSTFASMDPSSSKYAAYQEQIAINCTAKP